MKSSIHTYLFLFVFGFVVVLAQSSRDSVLSVLKDVERDITNFDKQYPVVRKLLKESIRRKDTLLIAKCYQKMADLLWYKSVYSESEDYYFKSIEILDSARYPKEYAYGLYSIGWIECVQKGREDKLNLLRRATNINYLIKDTVNIIMTANALSGAYIKFYKDDTTKTHYLDSSILILEKLIRQFSDKASGMYKINRLKSNLANNYFIKREYTKAYQTILQVLSSEDVVNNKLAYYLSMLIKIKILSKLNYKDSVNFYLRSHIAKLEQLEDDEFLMDLYHFLYFYEKENKNFYQALQYLERYLKAYDKTNKHLLKLKFEELEANKELFKKEQAIINLQKQKELEQVRNQQKNIIIAAILLSLIIIVFFLRQTILQNRKIRQLNLEITHQKNLLEQKNKDITDSIEYASRIQKALIVSNEYVQQHFIQDRLFKDYFTLYLPKDIVSGDFYWANVNMQHVNNPHYFAVCDCTGHGVPGAFMSLLNINYLTEAVQEKRLYYPNEILDYVRGKLINNLSYDEQQKDGMDATLIMVEKDFAGHKLLYYALANHQMVLVRDGEVVVLNGDKMPVGKGHYADNFHLYKYEMKEGDVLYMYTDGYKDQFGGEKGKRIMQKRFMEILKEASCLSMEDQKDYLMRFFLEWRQHTEQTDDVCVVGIKV